MQPAIEDEHREQMRRGIREPKRPAASQRQLEQRDRGAGSDAVGRCSIGGHVGISGWVTGRWAKWSGLDGEATAVDGHHRAVEVARAVRDQEDNRLGDLLRVGSPAERDRVDDLGEAVAHRVRSGSARGAR